MKAYSARVSSPRVLAVLVGLILTPCVLATIFPRAVLAQGEIRSFPSRYIVGRETLSDLMEVSAGWEHHLAIKATGVVVGWGGSREMCEPPTPNEGFVSVTATVSGSYGLKSDGSVVTWPSWMGPAPEPNEGFTAIDAGESFVLALRESGSVEAWGYNDYGQCDVPAPNEDFTAISAGHDVCIGLKSDGSVVTWGRNNAGQCVPPSPAGYSAVAAGGEHLLALRANGSIAAWGRNDDGQCDVPSPNSGFIAIAAGDRHSLGLKSDGTMVAWGDNSGGQCDVPEPNAQIVRLSASGGYNVALREDGTILEWGCAYSYSHRGASADYAGFIDMAVGPSEVVGLRADGTITWWGTMVAPWWDPPAPLPSVELIDVSASGLFCVDWDCWAYGLGVTRDGSIIGWGSWDSTWVPQPNFGFVATAAAVFHALALRSDGSIAAWGSNDHGECDVPEPNAEFVSIAAAPGRSAAVRADGSIAVWGNPHWTPTPNAGFVAVAISDRHLLALREDGSIAAGGSNQWGECDVPAPNSGFVGVAAGSSGWGAIPGTAWSCGVKEDGSIVTWGGIQDTPLPNEGYAAVATGDTGNPSVMLGLWDPAGYVADAGDPHATGHPRGRLATLELTPLPNPFSPSVVLRYHLEAAATARILIFDVQGRQVREFLPGARPPGDGSVRWDGRDDQGRNVPAGVYLARITDGVSEASCRVTLVR